MILEESIDGILIVHKMAGPTSHDVVDQIRDIFKIRKVGHTGTLDPIATGVLVVCLGKATKIIQFLPEENKEYSVVAVIGKSTDTFDSEGKIIDSIQHIRVDLQDIEKVCRKFKGDIEQVPPAFSALKVKGERLYKSARRGEKVEAQVRRVRIDSIHTESYEPPHLTLNVVCSRGTYIRSLVNDIGEELGTGAYVASLKRIRSGPFHLKDAMRMEQIEEYAKKGRIGERIISISGALQHMPVLTLAVEDVFRFCNGVPVIYSQKNTNLERIRVEDRRGKLIGIGAFDRDSDSLKPIKVLYSRREESVLGPALRA